MSAVRKYTRERGLFLVHTSVFRYTLNSAIFKAGRPPHKKELGTKERVRVEDERRARLSCDERGRGYQAELCGGGIGGAAAHAPCDAGDGAQGAQRVQDQGEEAGNCRRVLLIGEEQAGGEMDVGAAKVMPKKVAGVHTTQAVCMAAPPPSLKSVQPVNEAAKRKFLLLTVKCNLLTLVVATAKINFGSVECPRWVKKWLRWEMYSPPVETMASNLDLHVPTQSTTFRNGGQQHATRYKPGAAALWKLGPEEHANRSSQLAASAPGSTSRTREGEVGQGEHGLERAAACSRWIRRRRIVPRRRQRGLAVREEL
eukprot:1941415-Pleurochrysis_carterae.AAC.4